MRFSAIAASFKDGEEMARPKSKLTDDARKVAVYVRKSKVTETGKSIEIQKEKCISLACSHLKKDAANILICEVADAKSRLDMDKADILVYEDEGKSGFYADRPLYKEMLRDIENGKIRAVFCYKIDRISRRTVDLLNLVQQMEQKGIAFVSVSDNDINTSTRTGKIMLSLLSAIAEFERDIIAERITDNMYELAKEGRWLGGTCPLGYYSKKEKLTIGGKKTTINHLEPVEEEQKIVIRLYELFFKTIAYNGVASALNAEGYKTKNGKRFTTTAVKNILRNPVYATADADIQGYFKSFDVRLWANDADFDGVRGIMAYNKTEQTKEIDADSRTLDPIYTQKITLRDIKEWIISVGKHKGIISGTDWIKVQYLMKEISQKSARPKDKSKSLLSGLVRCVICGSSMQVRSESGRKNPDGSLRFHYKCSSKRDENSNCESSPNVKGYELDNYVIAEICKMGTEGNHFFDELINTRKTLLVKSREIEKELNALKRRLAQIDTDIQGQITNLRTAPENIKKAIYDDIMRLNEEQEAKQSRVNAIQEEMQSQDAQTADIEKARQTILDFPKLVRLVDYEGKLQLILRIVESVIVRGDEVHIFLKGTESGHFFARVHERSDVCHIEQDSIFYTPRSIRRKAYTFFAVKGRGCLYKPDSAGGNKIVLFPVAGIVALDDVRHQPQVVHNQLLLGTFVARADSL